MSRSLAARVAEIRARGAVRAWEYRQLQHAAGVWVRLRRLLADAESAYVISAEAAAALVAQGFTAHPLGGDLEPPKTILVVPAAVAARVPDARQVAVRMSVELLTASCLVLVRFPAVSPPDEPRSANT